VDGDPVIEHRLELWVKGDEAVIVELADGNAQPVGSADLHDGAQAPAGALEDNYVLN